MRQVLDELLRDRGRAIGRIAAGKVGNGGERSQPVHAVMLREALIFNGNGRIDESQGNLVIGNPDTVFRRLKLLERLFLSRFRIDIIDERGLGQSSIYVAQLQRIRLGFRRGDDVGFQIILELHCEDRPGDRADEHKRSERGKQEQHDPAKHVQHHAADAPRDVRLLLLIDFSFLFLSHLLPPNISKKRRPAGIPVQFTLLYYYNTPVNVRIFHFIIFRDFGKAIFKENENA